MDVVFEVGKEITPKELQTYIDNNCLNCLVFNILYGYYHIACSDTHILLYNEENEWKNITNEFQRQTKKRSELKIPIKDITRMYIDFIRPHSKINEIWVTLYPVGKILLYFDKQKNA